MKYNINVNQQVIIKSGIAIDYKDAAILEFCIVFSHSVKCKKLHIADKIYYWFDHGKIVADLPILYLKKDSVYRRMKKMCDLGLLNQHPENDKMNKSFYAFEELTLGLFSEGCSEPSEINPDTLGNQSGHPRKSIRTPSEEKPTDKIINDTNISIHKLDNPVFSFEEFPINEKKEIDFFFNQVVENFLLITGKKIKLTEARKSLMAGRKKEGYDLEAFKIVISKKNKEWKDDFKMKQYITPETLFAASNFTKYYEQEEINGTKHKSSNQTGATATIPKEKDFGF